MDTLPPLPESWKGRELPPLLTFGEAVELTRFWNLGGRHYLEDLRATGTLRSANEWPDGQRARYETKAVLALYPVSRS
jgi:hypothetical protein